MRPCRATRPTASRSSTTRSIEAPKVGTGYAYEADEVARCLAEGRTASDVMPPSESVALAETMDELRRQWDLAYPFESAPGEGGAA